MNSREDDNLYRSIKRLEALIAAIIVSDDFDHRDLDFLFRRLLDDSGDFGSKEFSRFLRDTLMSSKKNKFPRRDSLDRRIDEISERTLELSNQIGFIDNLFQKESLATRFEYLSLEVNELKKENARLNHQIKGFIRRKKPNMEMTVALGLLGSVASIISLIQGNKGLILNSKTVLKIFRQNEKLDGSLEKAIGAKVNENEIIQQATMLIKISKSDTLFLKRILNKCLPPYHQAIIDTGLENIDVEEAYGIASKCVCELIKMARRENDGMFPNDELKQLWKRFGCSV